MKARWFGICIRCHEGFGHGDDMVPGPRRVGWIHARCASGADDE